MRKSVFLILVPVVAMVMLLSGEAKSEAKSMIDDETAKKLSPQDLAQLERALDPNDQTPADDRHLILKKLVKLGLLGAILATPALAAALLPLKLLPLLLLLKKVPHVNIIPLPPPPPPVYYEPPYQHQYSPPQQYDAPQYNQPQQYSPPQHHDAPQYNPPQQAPPAYNPPMAQPAYNPPMAQPSYSPQMDQPSYQSSGYRK